jgi:CRP-like cAMP-binding protein
LELAEENFGMLQPGLERIVVSQSQILYDTGDPFVKMYFVESGLVSLLAKSADGITIEVGLIGCEGMLGVPYLFAQKSAILQSFALNPRTPLSIDAVICKPILDKCAMIQPILDRFFCFLLR